MNGPLTVGSLFAGIGGLDLGLERAGMRVIWQVEKDAYCRAVLAKHWPSVPQYEDVKDVGRGNLAPVDLICGGFPCQDISVAGKGAGLAGARSGLWGEYIRIVRELRPRYVLVENVSALLVRGLDRVLGDLAASGYAAEWDCLPASAVGAPHRRDRLFIIAHADTNGLGSVLATPRGLREVRRPFLWESFGAVDNRVWLTDHCLLSRDVDGVPDRVERIAALGNAVVPQVAEWIGCRIVEADAALRERAA
jgi:DNA (cytosine-5)-methyltransferase 1